MLVSQINIAQTSPSWLALYENTFNSSLLSINSSPKSMHLKCVSKHQKGNQQLQVSKDRNPTIFMIPIPNTKNSGPARRD